MTKGGIELIIFYDASIATAGQAERESKSRDSLGIYISKQKYHLE
jgi:hypothetical protein